VDIKFEIVRFYGINSQRLLFATKAKLNK